MSQELKCYKQPEPPAHPLFGEIVQTLFQVLFELDVEREREDL